MKGEYSGHLSASDPMFDYLRHHIFPQLGSDCSEGIRVFKTNGSNAVYIYEDRKSCQNVVGKFFRSERNSDPLLARQRLDRECKNISRFTSFLGEGHHAARILGRNDDLDCLLVVEYCPGLLLDQIIWKAIAEKDGTLLKRKLGALAELLVTVHNRSAIENRVDSKDILSYCSALFRDAGELFSPGEAEWFERQKECWRRDTVLEEDNLVLVHGDATPSNFTFGEGKEVYVFDMERVRYADRCFDVGRIAGELQHFFLRTLHDPWAAEEFIRHFLKEYTGHFPDREAAFRSITRRLPFYMGTTLLRIARNSYLEKEYRRLLVEAAGKCLRRCP